MNPTRLEGDDALTADLRRKLLRAQLRGLRATVQGQLTWMRRSIDEVERVTNKGWSPGGTASVTTEAYFQAIGELRGFIEALRLTGFEDLLEEGP